MDQADDYSSNVGGGYPGGAYGATGYSGGYGGKGDAILPPSRPTYFHTVSLGLLVMMPAVMFSLVSLSYGLLFHSMPGICWVLTGLCLAISFLFMLARPVRDGPRYWFNLGCLCFLATAAANIAGFWNMRRHFNTYWAYEGQRSYTNVSPRELALAHLDAGKILFVNEAHVQQTGAVGIMDEGRRYCVAPIVAGEQPAEVQFWAAGVDCCGADGAKFECGEVGNRFAHSGLVYLDYGRRRDQLDMFRKAAAEAGASHGTVPAKDALFVSWVEDLDVAQQTFWSDGVRFLVVSSLLYFGASVVLGTLLHFGRRARGAKSKLESPMTL
mmetsp:Transcript_76687/g.222650  ORF Transcript_76687/g.222650 Transcript_76687/m.222650 type:complete len:326 (-) Transcript_76687:80-1057(-)